MQGSNMVKNNLLNKSYDINITYREKRLPELTYATFVSLNTIWNAPN